MPRGDRTGPIGQGPRSGRGAGDCAGSNMPGFMSGGRGFGPGRGFGAGRGMGYGRGMGSGRGYGPGGGMNRGWGNRFAGWCRGFWQSVSGFGFQTRREEIEALQQDAADMEETLGQIKKRIKDLESQKQEPES